MDTPIVASTGHVDAPWIAAHLAILNEAAVDVRLDVNFQALATKRTRDRELVWHFQAILLQCRSGQQSIARVISVEVARRSAALCNRTWVADVRPLARTDTVNGSWIGRRSASDGYLLSLGHGVHSNVSAKGEAMDATTIRPGFQSVVPYLAIQGAAQLVEFLATAFEAEHTYRSPSGTHFEAKIGNSMLMIGDVGEAAPKPAHLFMYVEDAQALYARALEAGATSLMEPSDKPWGEDGELMIGAGVKDPAGNLLFLAGPKSDPR